MLDQAAQIISEVDKLKGSRGNFESHWQECAEFCLPRKADITVRQADGQKRTDKVFDSTAIWANEQFAGGLHGTMTNPALRWFDMRLMGRKPTSAERAWIDDCVGKMYEAFASPDTNFDPQMHEMYLDLGVFGTSVMFVGEIPGQGAFFQTRGMNECYVTENNKGMVDTVYRDFEMTCWQAILEFGAENLPAILTQKLATTPEEKFRFVHCVKPREKYDGTKQDGMNKPWKSVYVFAQTKQVISEGGFDEFPYLVPRWTKATNEIYGRSPAMNALADIKMLNEMSKTTIKAAQKIVDPALQVPDDGFLNPTRTIPGGLNYYRSGTTDRIEPIETKGDVRLGLEMENQRREAIMRAFHVDWLNLPQAKGQGGENTYMSAEEVATRRDEKMRLLGPMLARMKTELLGPMISRVFRIMLRNGKFLPVPPTLANAELRVEYVSPIAKAQKSQEGEGIFRLMSLIQPFAQVDPAILLNIDGDQLVRYGAEELYNVPARIMRTPEAAAELKAAMMQRQQAEMEKADATAAADIALKGSGAVKNVRASR